MYTKRKVVVKMLGMFILALILGACGGAQDASRAYSRGMINRGAIVPAENIRVHEYLNYYEQRFPVPDGDPMGLSTSTIVDAITLHGVFMSRLSPKKEGWKR